jgi:hypothetical protein
LWSPIEPLPVALSVALVQETHHVIVWVVEVIDSAERIRLNRHHVTWDGGISVQQEDRFYGSIVVGVRHWGKHTIIHDHGGGIPGVILFDDVGVIHKIVIVAIFPKGPETVNIGVMQEEERIVRTRGVGHVTSDEIVRSSVETSFYSNTETVGFVVSVAIIRDRDCLKNSNFTDQCVIHVPLASETTSDGCYPFCERSIFDTDTIGVIGGFKRSEQGSENRSVENVSGINFPIPVGQRDAAETAAETSEGVLVIPQEPPVPRQEPG